MSYLGHTLTWEKGRQLKSFDNIQFAYNANGIRTSKTVNGIKHEYVLDGTKILRETWGGNTVIPLYDSEDSVCGIVYNDMPYYFQKNLQGDVIALFDRNANVVAKYSYDAWGVCTVTQDTSGRSIATINPFRYRGYYYDAEIGMYYLQSRYYDPEIGRFINADEVVYIGIATTILGYNIFNYCYNDAPNLSDPTGYYTGALVLSNTLMASLSSALPGIMTGISASLASVKAAIATSWFIPVCVAAAAIAIIGIVYVVDRVAALMASAAQTVSAVRSKARAGGINPNNLWNYTVYIIVRKGTIDVVYVGITKRYFSRKSQHRKRFPESKFTMMPIATGLTRNQARAIEQTIITAYTLDTLVNMINSISPRKWSTFKSEFEQMSTLMASWIEEE
ncbi:MAG: RHS repeat-associated core domain-containing protein [Ruminococcaceae bacterium]|nr:RHS repeat-associated core domain-containing protein [Oscillospiraceae bacterium]